MTAHIPQPWYSQGVSGNDNVPVSTELQGVLFEGLPQNMTAAALRSWLGGREGTSALEGKKEKLAPSVTEHHPLVALIREGGDTTQYTQKPLMQKDYWKPRAQS